MNKKRILCFSPHPDDEILGCGGSLINASKNGADIGICYLTLGEYGSPKFSPGKLKTIRKEEALSVCKELGIKKKNIYFVNIPDNQINESDFGSFLYLISIIREFKPDLVYIPHENENYHDHSEASKLTQRALDMSGSNNFLNKNDKPWWVDNVLAYEVSTPLSRYQYAEDISEVIDEKIRILRLYKSQTYSSGNASDIIGDNARALSIYRASMSIGKNREVFQVIRVGKII